MQIIKKDNLDEAVKLITSGELVAFPTETVYGLGALATNDDAVRSVFAAKGRPSDNPLIVHVSNLEQVQKFAKLKDDTRALAAKHWPGSLTMILPVIENALPFEVTAGLDTVAVRMPDNQITLKLIERTGPIVGPSANLSGKPSPTTAQHVIDDLNYRIAAVIDDGPTDVGVESTVLDTTVEPMIILRPGVISAGELNAKQPSVLDILDKKQTPKAPGMKYRHYAPDNQVISFESLDVEDLTKHLKAEDAVMAFDDVLEMLSSKTKNTWSLGSSVDSANEQLYSGLRFFDKSEIDRIFVESMPPFGAGIAYNNRLEKASGGHKYE